MNKITALVPMKGHSERIPSKNIRPFVGKPLLYHILHTLQQTKFVNQIIIDTDSDLIKEKASSFTKVSVINRPATLCGDMVSMNKIIAHDMTVCESKYFLQTHSTNPLLTRATLEKAIETFFANLNTSDSLFSVTPWQTRLYWEDGNPVNHNPTELIRTQDLPIVYEENSCIYLFSRQSFESAGGRRIGLRPVMFPIRHLEAIDIDNEEDFILAEMLAKYYEKQNQK